MVLRPDAPEFVLASCVETITQEDIVEVVTEEDAQLSGTPDTPLPVPCSEGENPLATLMSVVCLRAYP